MEISIAGLVGALVGLGWMARPARRWVRTRRAMGLLLRHKQQERVAGWLLALLLATLRGRLGAALRARLHVLRDLPLLLRKRREVQALRKVKVSDVERFLGRGGSSLQTFKRKMGSGV
mgnify:CR=1 FL=1